MQADPRAEDRRTRIADAALELLATEGARGLSHRAVDSKLELPSGSTSYYFRSRAALLLAAAERLVALDMADLAAISSTGEGVAELVERWLSSSRRTRSLARMELLLTSARDPAFELMQKAREQLVTQCAAALPAATPAAARAAGLGLVALVDGLMLHGLVMGEARHVPARVVLEQIYGGHEGARRSAVRRPPRKGARRKV